jgi:hypothetical protein
VLGELEAMAKDGAPPMQSGPKPALAGAALRKTVMAIWCVCFCGMQWRPIAHCSPAGTGSASGAGCWTGWAATGGGLRGFPGAKRRGHQRPILSLAAQLL